MSKIAFTKNYSDHSTTQGFRFEFNCDRCGTGYRTEFSTYALGNLSTAPDTAGSMFGGIIGQAANFGDRAKSEAWQKAYDQAFVKAKEEIRPDFNRRPRCSARVCRKNSWNDSKGLCTNCALD